MNLSRLVRTFRQPPADPLVADLVAALSPDRVRHDAAERALLARDASVFEGGLAGPVCWPVSTAEVQAIMRIAAAHDRGVVPRGAGTGLSGGAILERLSYAGGQPIDPLTLTTNHRHEVVERVAALQDHSATVLTPPYFYAADRDTSEPVADLNIDLVPRTAGRSLR